MPWDDRSPVEQAAIDYCVPRGIRLSEFWDIWSDADRIAVFDWLAKEARCSGCGQDLNESMLKENTFAYRAEGVRCHGCHAIEVEDARLQQRKSNPHAGMRFKVTRREATNGRVDQPGATISQT